MLREQLKHREQNLGIVKLAAQQSNARPHRVVRRHDQPALRGEHIGLQHQGLAQGDALPQHQCGNSLNDVFQQSKKNLQGQFLFRLRLS